ncbi:hypothetical protein ACFPPE_07465 [Agromyces tardus]|uniref:hypothetical protein n=1 Tax=Agromyces tardus TaxID=2583849 RepID=UPI003620EB6D
MPAIANAADQYQDRPLIDLGVMLEDALTLDTIAVAHPDGTSRTEDFEGHIQTLIGRIEWDAKGRATVIPLEDGTAKLLRHLVALASDITFEGMAKPGVREEFWTFDD